MQILINLYFSSFPVQNKLIQSLDDYMIVMVYCRFSSQACPGTIFGPFTLLYLVPLLMMSLYIFLIRLPCVLMAVDEKKIETIAKQIAQQRTPQVYIHIYIHTYIHQQLWR